eukprot:c14772_g1_i1 orf=85-3021(+)
MGVATMPDKCSGGQSNRGREEKILVTVRVRPLSSRELAHHDSSAWDCVDEKAIAFKPSLPERSPHPKYYTFDRVFGPESLTRQVYEGGAKNVALSALSGLNATVFAYGQTSSGKTYTMRGITESAVLDIYNYIEKHGERDFVLRISALEIYNEVVRDLLNGDNTPLRLLDDPERGTVVERLVEHIVQDAEHLSQLLAVCEAQRQVGETTLNDTSSRSHQIIRLTVESYPRGVMDGGLVNSLVASLNFVDLAGSERASQTMSEGTRLKEGCHINRSLLTLSTIIRKLSGGKGKSGHLPYRDSKLTRILQNSLGGNARTAIICTMSPALSHVEQSRNTLFFATRAKEVTNSAHVNMVVSDKVMVKQLQREVARLEAELRMPETTALCLSETEALLHQKDSLIQKMEDEMKELLQQRDAAQARLDALLQKISEEEQSKNLDCVQEDELPCTPTSVKKPNAFVETIEDSMDEGLANKSEPQQIRQSTTASLMLVQEIRKLEQLQNELGVDANRALEALQKEVECLRLAQAGMNLDAASTISKLQAEIRNMHLQGPATDPGQGDHQVPVLVTGTINTSLMDEIKRLQAIGDSDKSDADTAIATLEEQLESVQKSIDKLVLSNPLSEGSPAKVRTPNRRKKSTTPITLNSSNRQHFVQNCSPSSPRTRRSLAFENNENNPPYTKDSTSPGSHKSTPVKREFAEATNSSRESTPTHRKNNSVDIKKMQSMFKTAAEENIRSIRAYVTELKERVAKLQYQKQLLVCQVLELEANGNCGDVQAEQHELPVTNSPSSWQFIFQKQQMQIIELWDICQVSIIHRTQFYLLFRGGDPSDAIYMEVELRRLTWLQEHFASSSSISPDGSPLPENQAVSLANSSRALKRERDILAKQMKIRLMPEEREELFQRWGIPLDTKQRKLQLAQKLWTDPHNVQHIQESAEVVARLVGFWEPGMGASKEMFELTFASPSNQRPWLFGWNSIASILNL